MSAADALMVVGAVGAFFPLVTQRAMSRSMTIAHCSMAGLMAVMVATHVPQWIYVVAALGLLGQAFHMAGCNAGNRTNRLCTVDLTAMGTLLLSMPSSGTSAVSSSGHHHAASSTHLPWAPAVVLACWLAAATLVAASHRRPSRGGVAIGSVLMILGMTPMAV
ncbi:hypothetical protein QM588_22570 [Rhodococcus sp. IEGM 1354]|uniref:hypothetical protein n=1 Tax=Rhodococcus sp. IEGM 1354 TaxID=3047088 RepID=UPI0024B806BD|nr:hypothetical protein [Rhodococcus sp. IEGM 1354]MDI9933210.1 hypothetical protein [Rhodococcus sp. IEGM 1354]